ncbi:MAG: hypothetical protein ACE5JL_12955 [Dehalococcoidia bacterium]
MAQIKQGVFPRMNRYLGGAGSGLAGPLCTACMLGMWGAVAAMGGAAASTAAAMGMGTVVDSNDLLGWLPVVPWLPVAVLRPISAAVAVLGLTGLTLNWRRHSRWGPFVLALPAVAYLIAIMYGWPSLVFTSPLVVSLYAVSLVALVSAGGWDIWIIRALGRRAANAQL